MPQETFFNATFVLDLKRVLGERGFLNLISLIKKYKIFKDPDFISVEKYPYNSTVYFEKLASLLRRWGRKLAIEEKFGAAEKCFIFSIRLSSQSNLAHVDLVALYYLLCRVKDFYVESEKVLNKLDSYGTNADLISSMIMEMRYNVSSKCRSENRKSKLSASAFVGIILTTLFLGLLAINLLEKDNTTLKNKEGSVRTFKHVHSTNPSHPRLQEKDSKNYQRNNNSSFNKVNRSNPRYIQLRNGASPYDAYFGKGIYDPNSFNKITFKNHQGYDAIVLLVDFKTGKVIRNEYIRAGTNFEMTKIPNDTYYIKVFAGKNWNPQKKFLGGKIVGGFETEPHFFKSGPPDGIIRIIQYKTDDKIYYSVYEITLYPVPGGNMWTKQINGEEFFGQR